MADACPFAVLAPLVLSGDGLCGRLRRGMSENDAGRNQNTVATVIDVWSLARGEATKFGLFWSTDSVGRAASSTSYHARKYVTKRTTMRTFHKGARTQLGPRHTAYTCSPFIIHILASLVDESPRTLA